MRAALDTHAKIGAFAIAMCLGLAVIRTAVEHLLPLRFRLKSMFVATAIGAVVFALLGFAFG